MYYLEFEVFYWWI